MLADAVSRALEIVAAEARRDFPREFKTADRIKKQRGWLPWWERPNSHANTRRTR